MVDNQQKSTRWALWIIVCLLAVVAYPLSLGPYAFVVDLVFLEMLQYEDDITLTAMMVYYPVFYALQYAPAPVQHWYQSYMDGWYISLGW